MTIAKISLLILAAVLCSGVVEAQASPEKIVINPAALTKPFPHFWEQMFGSGRAILSLRDSYRQDLTAVRDATGLTYVRFHAILDDEVGVYDEDAQGRPVYNFSYVDQIYDGLLEAKVKPFVEISFMPRKLAANLTPHPFWYKPLPSPPKDERKWAALITAFTKHLIQRYGRNEVEQWYFEVWNEPNIDFWDGEPKQETYFALYDVTAKAVKGADSKLRIGGPATAQAAWVGDFIAHCKKNNVPFDYVSTHVYGNEDSKLVFGKQLPITRQAMVAKSAKKVYDEVQAAAPGTPIIWSEYNATYMSQVEVTDSAFMGPYLASNILQCDGLTTLMSYWSFSDVFEEQGVVKTPFYGGYGLMAERSIPKSAFYAFALLHRLGTQRVPTEADDFLVTKRDDGATVLALWNYAEPGETVPSKTFRLDSKGAAKSYMLTVLDRDHGSGLKEWQDAGSPVSPTSRQAETIRKRSQLASPGQHAMGDAITLGPQSLALVEIQP